MLHCLECNNILFEKHWFVHKYKSQKEEKNGKKAEIHLKVRVQLMALMWHLEDDFAILFVGW